MAKPFTPNRIALREAYVHKRLRDSYADKSVENFDYDSLSEEAGEEFDRAIDQIQNDAIRHWVKANETDSVPVPEED